MVRPFLKLDDCSFEIFEYYTQTNDLALLDKRLGRMRREEGSPDFDHSSSRTKQVDRCQVD